jgi:hypothetical protein
MALFQPKDIILAEISTGHAIKIMIDFQTIIKKELNPVEIASISDRCKSQNRRKA